MSAIRVGVVGIGGRGQNYLRWISEVDRRAYLGADRHWSHTKRTSYWGTALQESRDIAFPEEMYKQYARGLEEYGIVETRDLKANVVAVCDVQEAHLATAREILTEEFGRDAPQFYTDYRRMLDETELDAVVVVSANFTHREIVVAALEIGAWVLCDKPLATTVADCQAIVEAGQRSGGKCFMGFNERSNPAVTKGREIVATGQIGQPQMVLARTIRPPFAPTPWRYNQAQSGGALNEKDCHSFDLFNWFINSKPERVMGIGGQHVLTENNDIIDHAWVLVEYANGAKGCLQLCLFSPPSTGPGAVLDAVGANGRIIVKGGSVEVYGRRPLNDKAVYNVSRDSNMPGHAGDLTQAFRFLDCIAHDKQAPVAPEAGMESTVICLAAEESVRRDGEWINIEGFVKRELGTNDSPTVAGEGSPSLSSRGTTKGTGTADRIREHLSQRVEEARRAGMSSITFRAGDIHSELGLDNSMPNVCQVLEGEKLCVAARIELVEHIYRPPSGQGANLEILYLIQS
jgi:predicted dehydrogenase